MLTSGFSTELTAHVLNRSAGTILTGSPTVYRAMKNCGVTLARPLRVVSSAGAPLTRGGVAGAPDVLGSEVPDRWGHTGHGMAIVNPWDSRRRGPGPDG